MDDIHSESLKSNQLSVAVSISCNWFFLMYNLKGIVVFYYFIRKKDSGCSGEIIAIHINVKKNKQTSCIIISAKIVNIWFKCGGRLRLQLYE